MKELLHPEVDSHWAGRIVTSSTALIEDFEELLNCIPTLEFEVVEILAKKGTQQCRTKVSRIDENAQFDTHFSLQEGLIQEIWFSHRMLTFSEAKQFPNFFDTSLALSAQTVQLQNEIRSLRLSSGSPYLIIENVDQVPQRVRVIDQLYFCVKLINFANPRGVEIVAVLLDKNCIPYSSQGTSTGSTVLSSSTPSKTIPRQSKKQKTADRDLDASKDYYILGTQRCDEAGEAIFDKIRIETSTGSKTNYFHVRFFVATNPQLCCNSQPIKVYVENATREKQARIAHSTTEKLNLFKAYPNKLLRTGQQPVLLIGEKICLKPYEPLHAKFVPTVSNEEPLLVSDPDVRFESSRLVRVVKTPIFLVSQIVDIYLSHNPSQFLGSKCSVHFYDEPEDKLLFACFNDLIDHISSCFTEGASVTVTDQYGHTALHWASIGGGSTAVGYLLQRGADINAKDNNGDAPVHLAVQGKKWATADILLQHGADVNQKNNQGQALIHHLALSGCRKRSLVETVVNRTERTTIATSDVYGCTPYTYATRGNNAVLQEAISNREDVFETMDTSDDFLLGLDDPLDEAFVSDALAPPPNGNGANELEGADVESLISVLRENSHDPHLILQACKGLQNAAHNYDSQKMIADLGAVPLLLKIMRENFSEVVIVAACGVLHDLALCPDNRSLIVSLGGGDTLLAAINSLNATNPFVACEALSLLVQNYENRVRLAELSPLPLLAETMNRHRSEIPTLRACLTIAENIGENQAVPISISPLLPVLIVIMAEHQNDPSVQELSCKVLRAFALNLSDNLRLIVKKNVLRAIVNAMKTHPKVNSLHIHASLALAACSSAPAFSTTLNEVVDDPNMISYLQLLSSTSSMYSNGQQLPPVDQPDVSSSEEFSEPPSTTISPSLLSPVYSPENWE